MLGSVGRGLKTPALVVLSTVLVVVAASWAGQVPPHRAAGSSSASATLVSPSGAGIRAALASKTWLIGPPPTLPSVASAGFLGPLRPPAWFGPGTAIFDDEFTGSSIDASKWSTCYPWGDCTNRGNNELQWYTPTNVNVGQGELDLIAVHHPVSTILGHFDFTSGLVQTDNHFSYQYGYAEARAWLPGGKGFWPAFWLLPTDISWPPEIDVMEAAGASRDSIAMTVHYGSNQQDGSAFSGPDFTAGWHTFGVDWEPDHITWYIDGVARKSFTSRGDIPAKPMYVILNLAIDGGDPPTLLTPFPSRMRVDYVRVWRH